MNSQLHVQYRICLSVHVHADFCGNIIKSDRKVDALGCENRPYTVSALWLYLLPKQEEDYVWMRKQSRLPFCF